MKKTVYTLNIDNFAPEICALTYPLIRFWADKIGADFHIIMNRKFPDYPVIYEKMQIYELGQLHKNDWNIYIDSDALVHPETLDWTAYLKKNEVCHISSDFANIRWRYDKYFLRDGRNIGSCNWNTIASDWCIDLWKPLDISAEEAISNIFPTVHELNTVIIKEHLIDDYALSRNIARYGLTFKPQVDILKEVKMDASEFYWHIYTEDIPTKVTKMKEVLDRWKIPAFIRDYRR